MEQISLLESPVPAVKRVAETSLQAYREIAPTLQKREAEVLAAVRQHPNATAYELVRHMGAFDVNQVRPRITSLFDKGLLERGEKRACLVTGKTVLTWRLSLGQGE